MKKSIFYQELKKYVTDYHPNLSTEDEFLHTRSELAEQTYMNCSADGLTNEDSIHEANLVLYAGLEFSTYLLVEDIIEEQFKNLNFKDREKFALDMYNQLQPTFSRYRIDDDFIRSSEYDNLYNEVAAFIDAYVRDNELAGDVLIR